MWFGIIDENIRNFVFIFEKNYWYFLRLNYVCFLFEIVLKILVFEVLEYIWLK